MNKEFLNQEQFQARITASYKGHKVFAMPSRTRIIWRYMSFAKFVWLIAKEALYFSRLDQHEDEWEGLLPLDWCVELRKYNRFNRYINCWHMNASESDTMWKSYGNPYGETVAIKTTVDRLIKSLGKSGETDVYIGKVKYKDPKGLPAENLYWPTIYKRKFFRSEKELRLCVSSSSDNTPNLEALKQELSNLNIDNWNDLDILKLIGRKGIEVPVDLNQLIQKVVLCPNRVQWLFDSVRYTVEGKIAHNKIVKSKYDLHKKI